MNPLLGKPPKKFSMIQPMLKAAVVALSTEELENWTLETLLAQCHKRGDVACVLEDTVEINVLPMDEHGHLMGDVFKYIPDPENYAIVRLSVMAYPR